MTVSPFLTNGVIDPADYKNALKAIHTNSVTDSIAKLGQSRILGMQRPDISASEFGLSREERCTLAQLRTGECKNLNDYLAKIGRSDSALCPECRFRRHTVEHLFNCDAVPTDLSTRDLWINPVTAIDFLKTLPSFSRLVSLNPPAPRPPPEPPPSGPPRAV